MFSPRFCVIFDMLLWSTLGVLRRLVQYPSGVIALARGIIGSIFLVALLYMRFGGFHWNTLRKNWLPLLLGGTLLGTNWAVLFEAYQFTHVGIAELFYFTNTIFIALLAPVFTKEKISKKNWLCILVALLGMTLVSGAYQLNIAAKDALGIALATFAALESAGVVLCGKKLKGISSSETATVQLIIASIILIPYTLCTADLGAIEWCLDTSFMVTLFMGVFHTGLAYILFFRGVAGTPAAQYTILSYIDPIFAILWGWLLLGETLNLPQIIGAVLIMGSLMYSELAKK